MLGRVSNIPSPIITSSIKSLTCLTSFLYLRSLHSERSYVLNFLCLTGYELQPLTISSRENLVPRHLFISIKLADTGKGLISGDLVEDPSVSLIVT